jgi:hypothetical protein
MLAGLERQLGAFMLLPFHTLDQISLHSRLEEPARAQRLTDLH